MPPAGTFEESALKTEIASLTTLLGDTRARYHKRQTRFASAEQLIEIDAEIRDAVGRPLSEELAGEIRRLSSALKALDPH